MLTVLSLNWKFVHRTRLRKKRRLTAVATELVGERRGRATVRRELQQIKKAREAKNKDEEKDPNTSPDSQPQPEQSQEKKDKIEQDMTAQAILDKEQRQNDERKKRQRSSYQKVDRDW